MASVVVESTPPLNRTTAFGPSFFCSGLLTFTAVFRFPREEVSRSFPELPPPAPSLGHRCALRGVLEAPEALYHWVRKRTLRCRRLRSVLFPDCAQEPRRTP